MKKLYFAYGANLNTQGMQYRCPDAVKVKPFYLEDWRLSFSGVATIQPSRGDYVPGALWELTDKCEKSLDMFEGWPTLYRKEIIKSDGLEFMVYIMNNDPPHEPSSGYLMTIAEGYQDWGLDVVDLKHAVLTTQEEAYDLYRNSNATYGSSDSSLERMF